MNRYDTRQPSRTASNVLISGILASSYFTSGAALVVPEVEQQLPLELFSTLANSPSFGQIVRIFPSEFVDGIDTQFEETISSFYAQLVESQESLGQEFERVLHENLWDLYER